MLRDIYKNAWKHNRLYKLHDRSDDGKVIHDGDMLHDALQLVNLLQGCAQGNSSDEKR
jgi:hypothetical protein